MSSTISTSFTLLLLLGLVSFLFAASIKQEEPANVQCHNNKECPSDHCCVLGGGRYTIPQCSPLLEEAATCRPNNELLNMTLHYPNDTQLKISDVYHILCPCNEGLICDRKEGVCINNN
ncbi:PREDICTED: astakine-like [Polistes dominula]|uniref:Astakine-like n=1 Tax=Polistes dominula TaxID=743375 RepID=A0ABM1IV98_POLDO|nr:PREDICTED: astakine-like [Polistes dominula]